MFLLSRMNKKSLIFLGIVVFILGSSFYFYKIKSSKIEIISLEKVAEIIKLSNCNNLEKNKILVCWDNLVKNTAKEQGVSTSLKILSFIYNNPKLSANCHSFAHTIGGEAYLQFEKNNKIDISPEMNFCGFGFYHGFMEELFVKGGDIQTARDLCYYMDKQTGNKWQSTSGACFHGIGHGVVDGENRSDWGNAQVLIKPGLELCDKVAATNLEHYRCYGGVFNSIDIAFSSGEYGLELSKEDAINFCESQKVQYQGACYSDMAASFIMRNTSEDLLKAAKLISSIKEDSNAIEAMRIAAAYKARALISKGDFNFKNIIETCKSIQNRLIINCIKGFGAGLVEFGPPGKEQEKAFEFCGNAILKQEEKNACSEEVIGLLRVALSEKQFNMVCIQAGDKLGMEWKDFCLNNVKIQ